MNILFLFYFFLFKIFVLFSFFPPLDKWNFVRRETCWTKWKKQMYLTWLCFSHLNVLKQLFNCPFHLKVEILFHMLLICLVKRCIKWWAVAGFFPVYSSLYNVNERPSDGARLHGTSCLHNSSAVALHSSSTKTQAWNWMDMERKHCQTI